MQLYVFLNKNSCAATVIRTGSWESALHLLIFLLTCLRLCACASVEPAEVTLQGSLVAIEGQDLNLSCYATSSNPPVHIRWWLGYKELNTSVVTMEEVRQHSTQLAQMWNVDRAEEKKYDHARKRYCTQWVIIGPQRIVFAFCEDKPTRIYPSVKFAWILFLY